MFRITRYANYLYNRTMIVNVALTEPLYQSLNTVMKHLHLHFRPVPIPVRNVTVARNQTYVQPGTTVSPVLVTYPIHVTGRYRSITFGLEILTILNGRIGIACAMTKLYHPVNIAMKVIHPNI